MTLKLQHWQLKQRQGLSLDIKIKMSLRRIRIFYDNHLGSVYVAFSGGKDSTVLLHLVRSLFPDVPAVFINTGLEYPEVIDFVRHIDNVIHLKPKLSFSRVIQKYGYPVISKDVAYKIYEIRTSRSQKLINKRLYGDLKGNGKLPYIWRFLLDAPFKISDKCCHILKRNPTRSFERKTNLKCIIGSMAFESRLRSTSYLKNGCITYGNRPVCSPIAFWTDNDIWNYIKQHHISYSSIYDLGFERTGCMYCMFGIQFFSTLHKFTLMKKTHPSIYRYCMHTLGLKDILIHTLSAIDKYMLRLNRDSHFSIDQFFSEL
jgi:3'-phosphoadenosine 5'-phosphosulfate sulfotransferase (PAPS reductase)/FAD synthetase